MPNNAALADDPSSWEQLIQAVATRQDRATFVRLFQHFAPRVKTFMLRSGASEAAAEEIARQTMVSVWRKAREFKPSAAGAAAWIFTIARNLRIDALRPEGRGGAAKVEDDSDVSEPQLDARLTRESQEVAAAQVEHCVRDAMAQLSNEQLRAIEKSFFEDKPGGEIAELLGPRLRSVLGHTS